MDDQARRAALRFIHSIDRSVDAESFSDDDAWSLMRDLVEEFVLKGRGLNQAQLAATRDFGHSIGISPGGPLGTYQRALEEAFGPSQLTPTQFSSLLKWAHAEVNGGGTVVESARAPVHLSTEYGPAGPQKKTDLK